MATKAMLLFFWHLMNFVAPAAFVAVVLALGARWVHGPLLLSLWGCMVLNFVLGSLVLGLGLVLSGSDGKLATYGALVLAMGSCQWLLTRTTPDAPAA